MKRAFLLISAIFFTACNNGNAPNEKDLNQVETPHEDLLQTIKNSYINASYNLSSLRGYQTNKHKEEIVKTLKIADTFQIKGYDQILVLYSYSIGSDIFRDSDNFKKVDGKWYRTYLYTSSYDDDPFKDGNGKEAKAILEKADKWEEESEEVEKEIFGTNL